MAELDIKTVEHILIPEVPTSGNTLPTIGRDHEQEDDHLHHGKKLSVLAKVKEKAKKWRQNLVRKKSGHDNEVNHRPHHTPSWGVALEDYVNEEEPDHNLESLENTKKESTDPLTSKKQSYSNNNTEKSIGNNEMKQRLPTLKLRTIRPILGKSYSDHAVENPSSTSEDSINDAPRAQSLGNHLREQHPSPSKSKFTLDTLIAHRKSDKKTEKKVSTSPEQITMLEETTQNVNGESTDFEEKVSKSEEGDDENMNAAMSDEKIINSEAKSTEKEAPSDYYATATEAINDINNSSANNTSSRELLLSLETTTPQSSSSSSSSKEEHEWDKGVSVKEYFRNKLEPGEDEKALSQVISEVISPKRSPTEKGVVEKVKTAMSMLLHNDDDSSSSPSSIKTSRSSSLIPVSVNAHEVEEESQEGGLQPN